MSVKRTYTTPDSSLTHLLHHRPTVGSVSLHRVRLFTLEWTHGVIDPMYHSRHNDRDRQYQYDHGVSGFMMLQQVSPLRRTTGYDCCVDQVGKFKLNVPLY